jgi:YesN/AraC family two-component response regulator
MNRYYINNTFLLIYFFINIIFSFAQELPLEENNVIFEIDSIITHTQKEKLFPKLISVINKYRNSGDYISTIIAIKKTDDYYDEIQNPRTFGAFKAFLGQAYNGLGLYSDCITETTKGLIKAEKGGELDVQFSCLMILSEAYSGLNLYKKANILMLKAYKISKEIDDPQLTKNILNNLANTYSDANKIDSAMIYLNKLESLENNKDTIYSLVHLNKCSCLFKQKKLDSALFYCNLFKKELKFFNNAHNKVTLNKVYSEIYKAKNNLKQSEKFAMQALAIAKKKHYNSDIVDLYKLLSEIYRKKRPLKSSNYLQKHEVLRDSIYLTNMKTAINNIKLLKNIEKKSSDITNLQLENKLKSSKISSLIILLISVFLILSILFIQKRKINKAYKKIVDENIKSVKEHEETVSLRKQILLNKQIDITTNERSVNLSQKQTDKIELRVRKLFDVEKIYLQKDLDLENLANLTETNRVYLSHVFNKIIKMSFNEMLNKYRINEAKKLLILNSEKYTIEAVALESGFKNKATFNRNFKNQTGITPSIFVKLAKEKF